MVHAVAFGGHAAPRQTDHRNRQEASRMRPSKQTVFTATFPPHHVFAPRDGRLDVEQVAGAHVWWQQKTEWTQMLSESKPSKRQIAACSDGRLDVEQVAGPTSGGQKQRRGENGQELGPPRASTHSIWGVHKHRTTAAKVRTSGRKTTHQAHSWTRRWSPSCRSPG